ncbi:hypothetical protein PAHAL_1G149300 [Panicum hallii]|uniref:Uncharacterized protein n=1 Tax=Panicum hallii TaxID=206008 RepID=A0A2T8KV95_9POAL|nr:hypothetical protein PAHAL_1G149300 [Panicum hallii]
MAPGRAKFPAKKPQKHRPVAAEQPLHPYEVERLQQCMRNKARLKEFGIHDLVDVLSNANSIAHKKNKLNCRNRENSKDEYDPTNNDTDEEDLLDDDTPEGCNNKTAAMRPEAIKTHSKRVFAEPQTTRSTRSKKTTSYRDANNGYVQIEDNMTIGGEATTNLGVQNEITNEVRNHMPVLKHWKDYKKNSALLQQFRGTRKAKFYINTNDASVQKACFGMMKNAIRQQHHRLKKQYFDPFPLHLVSKSSPIKSMTDEQWNDLVESWKRPKKMHHHTTGSRSYLVHVENLSEMETRLSASREGEQSLSPTKVVADVLAEKTKKSSFLKNIGIHNACSRPSIRSIEAQLEAEKRANGDLRAVVDAQREQLDLLSKQVKETEQGRIREQDEMKKKQAEMEAKLQLVLSQIKST